MFFRRALRCRLPLEQMPAAYRHSVKRGNEGACENIRLMCRGKQAHEHNRESAACSSALPALEDEFAQHRENQIQRGENSGERRRFPSRKSREKYRKHKHERSGFSYRVVRCFIAGKPAHGIFYFFSVPASDAPENIRQSLRITANPAVLP